MTEEPSNESRPPVASATPRQPEVPEREPDADDVPFMDAYGNPRLRTSLTGGGAPEGEA
jgi:hypothetical protein